MDVNNWENPISWGGMILGDDDHDEKFDIETTRYKKILVDKLSVVIHDIYLNEGSQDRIKV